MLHPKKILICRIHQFKIRFHCGDFDLNLAEDQLHGIYKKKLSHIFHNQAYLEKHHFLFNTFSATLIIALLFKPYFSINFSGVPLSPKVS
jgi:hypothetical protein